MDYGKNTKTPSLHRRLGRATLSQLASPGEGNPSFPWEKSHWDNAGIKKLGGGVSKKKTATPTLCEEILQNSYNLMEDSSGEEGKDNDHSDSDEDRDVIVTEHELEACRLIDVCILNQNIAS